MKDDAQSAGATKLEQGELSVNTKNLFPIIKRWLYSEQDIFLRELISNAHDAIKKLERLHDLGEYQGELKAGEIEIDINKAQRTLTIRDSGLGMSREEIKKYINQIAFSGAEEFIKRYEKEDQGKGLIGRFGLGFFSTFMVADLVELDSRSYRTGAKAAYWKCSGSTDFELGEGKRSKTGTDITLHLNQESEKYLSEETIKELVKKYSNFLPVAITVNGKRANEAHSPWMQEEKKVSEEAYKKFYQQLFPEAALAGAALFQVHLNVDYPFKLKGLLFFPEIKLNLDLNKPSGIKLFSNQVFVSENIEGLLPNYLGLLKGVLDSPDIPLNVSRSALQIDAKMKKLSGYVVKKVAEKIKERFKKERAEYEKQYQALHLFIKIGALSDEKFSEQVKEAILLKTVDGQYVTLEEYKTYPQQTDPAKELKEKVVYYTTNKEKEFMYLSKAKAEGKAVVELEATVDAHFIQHLETKYGMKFLRVDAEETEQTNQPKEKLKSEQSGEEIKAQEVFLSKFKEKIGQKELEVELKELANTELSGIITVDERMRRFEELAQLMRQGGEGETVGLGKHKLVLNKKNRTVKKLERLLSEKDDAQSNNEGANLAKNIYDLALLTAQGLKGQALESFVKRMNKLL